MTVGSQDVFLDVGNLVPVTGPDLNSNSVEPQYRRGGMTFLTDHHGFRIFQYCRIWNGSDVGQGELMTRTDVISDTLTSASTTTSGTMNGATLTANKHEGSLVVVDDNEDVAGGEPEGESAIITGGNTTTLFNVDPAKPFTVALASGDVVRVHSIWMGDDATSGDLAINCLGIVTASGGLTDQYYGWLQIYGIMPDTLHNAVNVASGAAVVTATAAVTDAAALYANVLVGYQIGTHTAASHDTNKSPVFVQLFGPSGAESTLYTG